MTQTIKAYIHASELLTGRGIRAKDGRNPKEEDLDAIVDGALVASFTRKRVEGRTVEIPGKILWVGKTRDLPKKFNRVRTQSLNQGHCLVPAFTDCHTHLVFAGNRAQEFSDRCGGMNYAEIAARGGGILHTVEATRKASEEELLKLAVTRVEEAMRFGTRTIEIKSGYGLDHESELKSLSVARKLRRIYPELRFHLTFLGAHAIPKESNAADYLEEVESTLKEVARKKFADSCDIFVDEGYFTVSHARKLLGLAKQKGLGIRIHADELSNTESAALAAKLGALSADHLLKISPAGIRALGKSETVAVLLPGTAFYLKAPYAPARTLIDRGVRVALSTDFNPGTCVTLNLPLIMTLSALYMGMTRAEIFSGVTYNAAKALGFAKDQGTLEVGQRAAVLPLPYSRFEEVYYRFGASGL